MTEKIIRVITDKPADYFRIEYMVSNVCNYKCWYCSPHAYQGDFRWTKDTDLLIKNFIHLLNYYKSQGKTKFELNLLGGEPTLWPDLEKFITALRKDRDISITVTTNGSRTLRWWDKHAELFDKILFSYHPSFANNEHYIQVLDLVYEKGVPCNALIMMDPKNWDKSLEMVQQCKEQSKHPWFVSLMEVHSDVPYTLEQKKVFKDHNVRRPNLFRALKDEFFTVFRTSSPKVVLANGKKKSIERNWISVNNLNNFKGWMCNIGIENINIQKDGIITGTCMEIPYGEDFYYNIHDEKFTEKFNPELKPVMCTKTGCYCQPEMLMTKWKP
jgi:MoaA/NifB/PqqE/SkfB family radical SAM enzyme